MKLKKLHDDWLRLGLHGRGYQLAVGPNFLTVIIRDDEAKKTKRYRIDRVYVQLVKDAYARGLKHLPLV